MKPACRATLIVVAAAMLAGLAACGATNGTGQMNLQEAKTVALNGENETAKLVPSANIASSHQHQEASLLSCSSGGYRWPGQTRIVFAGNPDRGAIVDTIARHWKSRDGYDVHAKKTSSGQPRVDVTGTDGSFYSISVLDGGSSLYIDSFSPCFTLKSGQDPGTKY